MKKLRIIIFVLTIFSLCLNAKCDDDDLPANPIDQLPPATQTGEQTFGCLINGEPFVPPAFGRNAPRAFYQFVDGAYTFNFNGSVIKNGKLLSIAIGGIDIEELKETNYGLLEEESGSRYGQYLVEGGLDLDATTNSENIGNMIITKFDNTNFTVSGTFDFTVFDDNGNEIKITDGRFDLNYTN